MTGPPRYLNGGAHPWQICGSSAPTVPPVGAVGAGFDRRAERATIGLVVQPLHATTTATNTPVRTQRQPACPPIETRFCRRPIRYSAISHLNSCDLCDPLRRPACPSSPTDQRSLSLPFGSRPLRRIPPPPIAPQIRRPQTDRTTVGRLAPHLIRAIYLPTGGTVATLTHSDPGGRPWPGRAAQSRRRHPRQGRPPALPPPGPGCSAPPGPRPSRSTPSPR